MASIDAKHELNGHEREHQQRPRKSIVAETIWWMLNGLVHNLFTRPCLLSVIRQIFPRLRVREMSCSAAQIAFNLR